MRFTYCHVLLLLSLTTFIFVAADREEHATVYGQLQIPESYFAHPDSEDMLNQIQPGTVLLTNPSHEYRVPVQKNGFFVIPHVAHGSYLLQLDFHDFIFPTVLLEIDYKEGVKVDGEHEQRQRERVHVIYAYMNDFPVRLLEGNGVEDTSPVLIPVEGVHSYYVPREQFHFTDILKNPMILMMLVSFAMFGLVKLFPEEDLKQSQKLSREWQNKLFNKADKAIDTKTTK